MSEVKSKCLSWLNEPWIWKIIDKVGNTKTQKLKPNGVKLK